MLNECCLSNCQHAAKRRFQGEKPCFFFFVLKRKRFLLCMFCINKDILPNTELLLMHWFARLSSKVFRSKTNGSTQKRAVMQTAPGNPSSSGFKNSMLFKIITTCSVVCKCWSELQMTPVSLNTVTILFLQELKKESEGQSHPHGDIFLNIYSLVSNLLEKDGDQGLSGTKRRFPGNSFKKM